MDWSQIITPAMLGLMAAFAIISALGVVAASKFGHAKPKTGTVVLCGLLPVTLGTLAVLVFMASGIGITSAIMIFLDEMPPEGFAALTVLLLSGLLSAVATASLLARSSERTTTKNVFD